MVSFHSLPETETELCTADPTEKSFEFPNPRSSAARKTKSGSILQWWPVFWWLAISFELNSHWWWRLGMLGHMPQKNGEHDDKTSRSNWYITLLHRNISQHLFTNLLFTFHEFHWNSVFLPACKQRHGFNMSIMSGRKTSSRSWNMLKPPVAWNAQLLETRPLQPFFSKG